MNSTNNKSMYLDADALAARTGLSLSTIHRLKRHGKIRFYQPGGKGTRILFPPNAIEQIKESAEVGPEDILVGAPMPIQKGLSGPRPTWMKSKTNTLL